MSIDKDLLDRLMEGMRRFRPIDFAIAARLSTACLSL